MVAVNGPYFAQSCPWLPPRCQCRKEDFAFHQCKAKTLSLSRLLWLLITFVIYFHEIKNLCWYLILCISSIFYNIFFPCSIPKLLGVTSRSPVGCRQPRASSREIWPNPVGLAVTSHSWRWSDEWLVNLSTWSEGYSLVCEIHHKYP